MSSKRSYRYYFRSILLRRMFIALLLLAQLIFFALSIWYYANLQWVNVALRLLAFLTAFHLLTHPQPASMKVSMVFLILLFPLFGGAVYWFFRFQTTTIGYRKALRKIERSTLPAFRALGDTGDTARALLPESRKLIHYLDTLPKFPVYRNTETQYYPNGEQFQEALLSELRQAKRYIFLEFFIIGEGEFWESVLEVLRERAENGVDVRVIYDDLGCFATLPPKYMNRLRSYGIQCQVFNPFVPFLTAIQNNRDHRKIVSIDGTVAFTGGINLADEYINRRKRFGYWKDAAIKLTGDGAWSFTVMFLQMWSFLVNRQEDWERYYPLSVTQAQQSAGWVQPYTDSPMDRENVGEQVFLQMIGGARKYLYITSPYLAPDDSLLSALKSAAKSGVDVRILLPGIPDKRMVQFTGRSYYRELLQAGVRIFEYADGFVHSKNIVADDLFGSVGTVNLDFRSLYWHFECGVCLYRTQSLQEIHADFLETLEHCREISLQDCRVTPFKKLLQEICRLFAPMM